MYWHFQLLMMEGDRLVLPRNDAQPASHQGYCATALKTSVHSRMNVRISEDCMCTLVTKIPEPCIECEVCCIICSITV